MDVLPKEMLLEIFHFLSARDLIALTETCSTFYRLISSSEKLLNKVPLYLNVDVDKLVIREFIPRGATEVEVKNFITEILINGCRTYSRIVVGDIEGGIGVDILHRFGSSVRQLTFRRGFYGLKHICKMLVVCPNVNRLKFTRGSLRGDIDVAGLELPRLYIQSLHLENVGSQIFSILKESKVSFKVLNNYLLTCLILLGTSPWMHHRSTDLPAWIYPGRARKFPQHQQWFKAP